VRIVDMAVCWAASIEKLLDPAKQDGKCEKCTDARKDQPVSA
jgi:hypothetical protein